jgi:hypothetical protein
VVAINSVGTVYGDDQVIVSLASTPAATTLSAWGITGGNAKLVGSVNPEGAPTSIFFEWGSTTDYGNFTATNTIFSLLNTDQEVTMGITGMTPGITNHYRVIAINAIGTAFGNDMPILPYPSMGAVRSGTNVLFYWPTNYPFYNVQTATNLAPPILWTPDAVSVGESGPYNVFTNPAPAGQRYFRIIQ